jgi:hypothetical protein
MHSSWQVAERGRRSSSRRKAYRPQVEGLEGRWLPGTVTTLADAGPGSLRDAIANTPADGTVDFQPGLTGTITLTSAGLTIDHALTISGPGAKTLAVSGGHQFTVLAVNSLTVTATVTGPSIVNGAYNGIHGLIGAGASSTRAC